MRRDRAPEDDRRSRHRHRHRGARTAGPDWGWRNLPDRKRDSAASAPAALRRRFAPAALRANPCGRATLRRAMRARGPSLQAAIGLQRRKQGWERSGRRAERETVRTCARKLDRIAAYHRDLVLISREPGHLGRPTQPGESRGRPPLFPYSMGRTRNYDSGEKAAQAASVAAPPGTIRRSPRASASGQAA